MVLEVESKRALRRELLARRKAALMGEHRWTPQVTSGHRRVQGWTPFGDSVRASSLPDPRGGEPSVSLEVTYREGAEEHTFRWSKSRAEERLSLTEPLLVTTQVFSPSTPPFVSFHALAPSEVYAFYQQEEGEVTFTLSAGGEQASGVVPGQGVVTLPEGASPALAALGNRLEGFVPAALTAFNSPEGLPQLARLKRRFAPLMEEARTLLAAAEEYEHSLTFEAVLEEEARREGLL